MEEQARKIKLVLISPELTASQVSREILYFLANFDRKIFNLFLICPDGYLLREADKIQSVEIIKFSHKKGFLANILLMRSHLLDIQAKSYPFDPLIIHCFDLRMGIFSRLGLPPKAVSVLSINDPESLLRWKWPKKFFADEFSRFLNYSKTVLITVPSLPIKNLLMTRKLAPSEKTVVLPSLFEENYKKKKIKEVNKEPIIGISAVNWDKNSVLNLAELLHIFLAKCPMGSFEIVTDDQGKNLLDSQIKIQGYERHLATFRSDSEAKINNWDALLVMPMPLIFEEKIINQCMEIGVPMVGDGQSLSGIIKDGKNGLLFYAATPLQIYRKIEEIINHPAKSARYKQENIKIIKEHGSKNIKILEQIYKNIIQTI